MRRNQGRSTTQAVTAGVVSALVVSLAPTMAFAAEGTDCLAAATAAQNYLDAHDYRAEFSIDVPGGGRRVISTYEYDAEARMGIAHILDPTWDPPSPWDQYEGWDQPYRLLVRPDGFAYEADAAVLKEFGSFTPGWGPLRPWVSETSTYRFPRSFFARSEGAPACRSDDGTRLYGSGLVWISNGAVEGDKAFATLDQSGRFSAYSHVLQTVWPAYSGDYNGRWTFSYGDSVAVPEPHWVSESTVGNMRAAGFLAAWATGLRPRLQPALDGRMKKLRSRKPAVQRRALESRSAKLTGIVQAALPSLPNSSATFRGTMRPGRNPRVTLSSTITALAGGGVARLVLRMKTPKRGSKHGPITMRIQVPPEQ